jgi:hypothetical protein
MLEGHAAANALSQPSTSPSTLSASGGHITQFDRVPANPFACCEAQRGAGAGEEWLSSAKQYGLEIELILID